MMTARKKDKLVCGVGINDADYQVYVKEPMEGRTVSGQRKQRTIWSCPYYVKWVNMITRCYSEKYHKNYPTYKDCYVCEDWLTFSNFKQWMESQDWNGKQLDKDMLVTGNKEYNLCTCVFIPDNINTFLVDGRGRRGEYLLGCYWDKASGKFRARIHDPFKKKSLFLGYFDTEVAAHLVWKKKKHELACQLANSEYVVDERVKQALENRYKNFDILEDHIK